MENSYALHALFFLGIKMVAILYDEPYENDKHANLSATWVDPGNSPICASQYLCKTLIKSAQKCIGIAVRQQLPPARKSTYLPIMQNTIPNREKCTFRGQKVKRNFICTGCIQVQERGASVCRVLVLSATCIKTRYFIQTALLSLTLAWQIFLQRPYEFFWLVGWLEVWKIPCCTFNQ